MNKVYKTIWSKVRNCYVVVSELAKSKTKSPSGSTVGSVKLEDRVNRYLRRGGTEACMPTGFVTGAFAINGIDMEVKPFKITVAAIVKNEAENVPQWVQAARSCADEIIVVDTGSTDGTVERFHDYGIECYHYEWHDDFASAKNYMISLCHGDWIVLLDGDEWFREGCDVRKAIAKHHANPMTKAIIADWICLDKDRNNAVMFSGGAVRAFRNSPEIRYFRKVHENLTIGYENFVFEPDFKMYHTGYSGSVNRSKHERNLRIMRTMFDFDNGIVEFPTDWRYIEDTYAGLGQFDKALWAADKMISYGVQEYSAAAWITKFNVLFALKTPLAEMRKQFEYCFRTVPSVSGFRFLASIYYFRNGQIEVGLDNYIEGLRMLMSPQDKVAQEHTYWRMYMPEASALASAVYLQSEQVEASLYACKVSEQYCGQTDWTNGALADVRRVMKQSEETLVGNIMERVLPVFQFAQKGVLATALLSSLTVGMVANPAFAACCNLNGVSCNTTTGSNSTVTGGRSNSASGEYTSVSGGIANKAIGTNASVSGGFGNTASGCYSSVSGGCSNMASGLNSSVSGGYDNTASCDYASVSGGFNNTASGCYSSVSGGYCNTASGLNSSVSGGYCNTASGEYSSVSGGYINNAIGSYSSVTSGTFNKAEGFSSIVVGGDCNTANGSSSVVSGGSYNTASACISSVSGGMNNKANGVGSSISGGFCNTIDSSADYSSISGGCCNMASGCFSSISGGSYNMASGCFSSVSGGRGNTASGCASSVSGGCNNTASCWASSVSGGCGNTASGSCSSVSGGVCNTASDSASSVSGGMYNTASGSSSSVTGGRENIASSQASSVTGGRCNTANAFASSVSGGCSNTASGYVSWVAGGCNGFAYANYSSVIGGGITGNVSCSETALGSVAIGNCATTTRDYEVAIGSSDAPVKIDGELTVDGAKTVTDGTTTKTWADVLSGGSEMTGASSSTDGTVGLVKAPVAGDQNKFLRGDGTWADDNNTTYDSMLDTELSEGTSTVARSISAKTLADYVGTEISTESTARTNADTALGTRIDNAIIAYETADTGLSNRIGSLTADGNYIRSSGINDVSANLLALDTQLKATDISSLKYDGDDHSLVTMGGTNGTKLTNLKQGTLSATSTDAVTGAQLYAVKQDITGFAGDINRNKASIRDLNASISTALESVSSTGELVSTMDDLKADASLNNLTAAGQQVITNAAVNAVQEYMASQAEPTLGVTKPKLMGSPRLMAVNPAPANTNYVVYDDTTADTITLEGAVGTGTKITNVAEAELSAASMDAVNGSQLYAVTQQFDEFQSALSNNNTSIARAQTDINTIKTTNLNLQSAVNTLNTQMETGINVTTDGALVKNINPESNYVNFVTGDNIALSNDNGSVKISAKSDGVVTNGNTGLVSGGTVYNAIQDALTGYSGEAGTALAGKANADASNIGKNADTDNSSAWGQALGTGTVSQNDDRLVTGKTMYDELRAGDGNYVKSDKTTGQNLQALDTAVGGLQDTVTGIQDTVTGMQDDITGIQDDITGIRTDMDGKADKDLSNLSDSARDVIRTFAQDGIDVTSADSSVSVAKSVADGRTVFDLTVVKNGKVEEGDTGILTGDTVYQAIKDINPYGDNVITGTDSGAVGKRNTVAGNGSYTVGNDNTVADGSDDMFVLGSNVNATGHNSVVLGKDSDGSQDNVVSVGSDGHERRIVHVADGTIAKNSKDAVNGGQLYDVREDLRQAKDIDTDAWSKALGTGEVAEGNTSLVNGGTVYDAIQKLDATNGAIIPDTDAGEIHIGGTGRYDAFDTVNIAKADGTARVLRGVATDPNDLSSAANVGYVNAIGQNIVKGVNEGFTRVNDRMDKVGAGAAAMAGLVPGPMEGDEKWSLSAAVGNYRSATAGAVGAFYKPTENVVLAVKGAFGNGENMVSGGIGVTLNKGNVPGVTKAQLVRTVNAQANEIQTMKAAQAQSLTVINEQAARIERLETALQQVLDAQQKVNE